MLPFIEAVRLNQYAQGIRSETDAKEWFSHLNSAQKRNVLHQLAAMVQQAHATPSDLSAAILRAGLKPTHTPSVLLSRGTFNVQAAKVIALPEQEYEKAYLLFLALVGIADTRRRNTECANGCSHWWHKDLSDELLVQGLLRDPSGT